MPGQVPATKIRADVIFQAEHTADTERLSLIRRRDKTGPNELHPARAQPFIRPQWQCAGQIGADAQIGMNYTDAV